MRVVVKGRYTIILTLVFFPSSRCSPYFFFLFILLITLVTLSDTHTNTYAHTVPKHKRKERKKKKRNRGTQCEYSMKWKKQKKFFVICVCLTVFSYFGPKTSDTTEIRDEAEERKTFFSACVVVRNSMWTESEAWKERKSADYCLKKKNKIRRIVESEIQYSWVDIRIWTKRAPSRNSGAAQFHEVHTPASPLINLWFWFISFCCAWVWMQCKVEEERQISRSLLVCRFIQCNGLHWHWKTIQICRSQLVLGIFDSIVRFSSRCKSHKCQERVDCVSVSVCMSWHFHSPK